MVALPWFLYSIAACSVSPNVSHRAAHGYDESNRTSSSRQYSKRIQGNKGNDDDQGTDCGGCAYSGFEGIEDNTDRIQTREEVEAEQSAGKTLANALKAAGVSRVDVVGIAESHCVKDTALDAKKLGFEVTVFEDLTVPVSEELGVAARKQMAAGGITLAESR